MWRVWTGTRGTQKDPVERERQLFAFLTCGPNEIVRPIHPKAMPVILHPEDWDTWLHAPAEIALELQRPWDGKMVMLA